jgi:cytochrome c oxidase subunit 2
MIRKLRPRGEAAPATVRPAARGVAAALLCAALAVAPAAGRAADLKAEDILRAKGCVGCHKIPGLADSSASTIGPNLTGLGDRRYIAGGKLMNNPKNMRRWLTNPKDVKTTMMPNTGLTPAEIEVLIKFLATL